MVLAARNVKQRCTHISGHVQADVFDGVVKYWGPSQCRHRIVVDV